MSVHLDHAAATPVDARVITAMQPFFSEQFYNPSALYGPAVSVSRALEQARADVASVLGAKASEIIFTAGGTEANNIAIHGVMGQFAGSNMVISAIEHDSVRAPAERYNYTVLPVSEQGVVAASQISQNVNDSTVLVSVMYANNEVGTVQPIKLIAAELAAIRKGRLARRIDTPLYFHVDAAQAGNYLDLHVHRLGVDLMTLNGGKLYGPKQSGVLYVRSGVVLQSLLQGGGQERGIRSGTENVAAAVGFARALQLATEMRHDEVARLSALQADLIQRLRLAFPSLAVNGSLKHRLPNNVHITIPETDNERVLMALDMESVYAAAGSACSASHDEPSHVLAAMGFDEGHIRSSLRLSMGRETDAAQLEQFARILQKIV